MTTLHCPRCHEADFNIGIPCPKCGNVIFRINRRTDSSYIVCRCQNLKCDYVAFFGDFDRITLDNIDYIKGKIVKQNRNIVYKKRLLADELV